MDDAAGAVNIALDGDSPLAAEAMATAQMLVAARLEDGRPFYTFALNEAVNAVTHDPLRAGHLVSALASLTWVALVGKSVLDNTAASEAFERVKQVIAEEPSLNV